MQFKEMYAVCGPNETEEMTMMQNLTTGVRPDEVLLIVRVVKLPVSE
jgi:hypothetical protein